MISDTLSVESQSPPARCTTKPRSVCIGPPRNTCRSRKGPAPSSISSCSKISPMRMGSGLLTISPSAPRELWSHTSATLCAKFGSPIAGMAISSWFVRYPDSLMVRLRVKDAGALRCAAQELPFVRYAYLIMLCSQFARKRIKRRCELQDSHGGFVQFRVPAAAPDHSLQQFSVRADGHFDHRSTGELFA